MWTRERQPAEGLRLVEKVVGTALRTSLVETGPMRGSCPRCHGSWRARCLRGAAERCPTPNEEVTSGSACLRADPDREFGKAASVAGGKVAEIPGVVQADDVTGPYDVIIQAKAETVDDLGKID